MDEDDFWGSILDDTATLADSATRAGSSVIQQDITGRNTAAANSSFVLLLLIIGVYLALRK